MKDTFYFPHDYNARTDKKSKALIRKHGMKGYGTYWAIVEDLYNNANALRLDFDGIAYDLREDSAMVQSIITDFDLFVIENDSFGSLSVERRLDKRNEKSSKARQSAFARWDKDKPDANVNQSQSDSNAIKEKKRKESKKKESGISFNQFWDLYDKKVGDRVRIKKKWDKLSNTNKKVIIKYIPLYKSSQPDKKYRKNPETFLNQKSWNDEIIQSNGKEVGIITKDIKDFKYE